MYADLDHLGAALLGAALLLASRSPRLLPMLMSQVLVAMDRWAAAQGDLPDRALRDPHSLPSSLCWEIRLGWQG